MHYYFFIKPLKKWAFWSIYESMQLVLVLVTTFEYLYKVLNKATHLTEILKGCDQDHSRRATLKWTWRSATREGWQHWCSYFRSDQGTRLTAKASPCPRTVTSPFSCWCTRSLPRKAKCKASLKVERGGVQRVQPNEGGLDYWTGQIWSQSKILSQKCCS